MCAHGPGLSPSSPSHAMPTAPHRGASLAPQFVLFSHPGFVVVVVVLFDARCVLIGFDVPSAEAEAEALASASVEAAMEAAVKESATVKVAAMKLLSGLKRL